MYEMPEGSDFDCLTRDDLEAYEPLMSSPAYANNEIWLRQPGFGIDYNRVWIMRTSEGTYVKLTFHHAFLFPVGLYVPDYVAFRNPEDY